MPSPVGHSLIGLSVGLLYAWPRGRWPGGFWATVQRHRFPLFLSLMLANLPDIDYVPGILTGDLNAYHHQFTHTLGWVVLVAAGVWMIWKAYRPDVGVREAVFVFACLASHVIADAFTDDSSYPFGVMLLWPVTAEYYISPQYIFPRPLKADWGEVFDWHNARVMGVEFLITAPLVVLVLLIKRGATRGRP